MVAERLRDDGGEVIGTNGFYVDVTFPPRSIDADAAFDLLTWRSQAANIKVRVLAEQLLADFRALNYDDTLPSRPLFDQLLLTAPQPRPAVT